MAPSRLAMDIEPLGEDALLLRFGDGPDATVNTRVHAVGRRITALEPPWLRDIVPAYASLALFIDFEAFPSTADPLEATTRWLRQQALDGDDAGMCTPRMVEIPVLYGGVDGPDLEAVAAHAGMSTADAIERHAAGGYTVAMLGFAPGFPYLLGLDPALAIPRLQTPRTHVAAGSVGIGGAQTGIYPRPGPGGWRIIGRTSAVLFDPLRESPSLLLPGDRVRFRQVDALP
jgi:KipI family sensor histidine kinase inhibitor